MGARPICGAQAGKVLRIVTEEKHAKEGKEADPKMLEMLETVTAQKLDSQSTALYGTASLWDDGLVDPRDSRRLLGYLVDAFSGRLPRLAGLRRRAAVSDHPDPADLHLPTGEARHGPGPAGDGHGGGADRRADPRRLDHRRLQLAVDCGHGHCAGRCAAC